MKRPCYVYRVFGEDDTLLYIGIAHHPGMRMAHHAYTAKFFAHTVFRVSVCRHETRAEALRREAEAIRHEQPVYNVAHNIDNPRALCNTFCKITLPPQREMTVHERFAAIRDKELAKRARRASRTK